MYNCIKCGIDLGKTRESSVICFKIDDSIIAVALKPFSSHKELLNCATLICDFLEISLCGRCIIKEIQSKDIDEFIMY